jgi:hypothetical protein
MSEPASMNSRRAVAWVAGVLVVAGAGGALLVRRAHRAERWPGPVRPATAMGDSTCLSCHRDKASFEGTAHRLTSRHPDTATVAGHLTGPKSVLRTPNPALYFRMSADSTGIHQTAVQGTGSDTTIRTERVAYAVGSDRKGQSYLYWRGDSLYQMPVSYWKSLDGWINSPGPGYADGRANFNRPVDARCLECHATWIESKPDLQIVNRFDSTSAILGITCHDVHATQRDVKQLSGKCLTCHQEQSCKLFPTQGHSLAGRCVECHMPLQSSNLIVSTLEGRQHQAQVRSHWIKVYKESLGR